MPRAPLALMLLALAPLAHAGCGGTLVLRSDNDVYGQAGQDENYSAGARIQYVSPTLGGDASACLGPATRALDRATGWLRFGADGQRNLVFGVHHAIYTPVDGQRADLVADDRPYAGVLLFDLAQQVRDGDRLATTSLALGLVGPSAQGEMAQDVIHHLFGRPRFRGWDNQLPDEALLQVEHTRLWRSGPMAAPRGLEWDRVAYAGGTLGSPLTRAFGGIEWRLGRNLPDDFGSNPMRPSGDGTAPGAHRAGTGWDWHFFASVEARAIARDVTLDGTLGGDSHSVDRRPLVGELGLGVVLSHGPWRFAGGHYRRSREFDGQLRRPVYGSITVARQF